MAENTQEKNDSKSKTLSLKSIDTSRLQNAIVTPKTVIVEHKKRKLGQVVVNKPQEPVGLASINNLHISSNSPVKLPLSIKANLNKKEIKLENSNTSNTSRLTNTEMEKRARALEIAKQRQKQLQEEQKEQNKIRDEQRESDQNIPVLENFNDKNISDVLHDDEIQIKDSILINTNTPELSQNNLQKNQDNLPLHVEEEISSSKVNINDKEQPKKPFLKPILKKIIDDDEDSSDDGNEKNNLRLKMPTDTKKVKAGMRDRNRKLTVTNALAEDDEKSRSLASFRRKLNREARDRQKFVEPTQKMSREVIVPEQIVVQDLANRMAERASDVIKELMKLGVIATLNQKIDADTAELIVTAMGHTIKRVSEDDVESEIQPIQDTPEELIQRAPVVTIMGHVDHGKTSLLDALRHTNVVADEAGGITQHIGAYQVETKSGKKVTFLDTPGHAAFSSMRARGARVTDIVILVVAADDGVMPQTIEAISHAKAANVPIIVAINKIDKHTANPDQVKTELLQHDIVVESLGGEILDVAISAMQKTNLDGLVEAVLLQAEILDLKANPNRVAEGTIVEAELDKGRGPVGTLLVRSGTLKIGDIVVAGCFWGKVRAMINDHGQKIEQAGPSVPVEVMGLNGVPQAGDKFVVVESEASARVITAYRIRKLKETLSTPQARTLDSMMSDLKKSEAQSLLPIVIKADVHGSMEAITSALEKAGNDEVKIQVLHAGVGGITESDISLANASKGIVLGFNVRANKQARELSESLKTEIRYYSIIYNLLDDMKAALSGLLAPELREKFLGNAEIMQVFDVTKVGRVAGCRIREGIAKRSAKVRLIRDNVVIHEGVLSTLRRFKDEVKEVREGYECGMAFENYNDIRVGDTIEIFEIQEVIRNL